jgi:hypothetical protein
MIANEQKSLEWKEDTQELQIKRADRPKEGKIVKGNELVNAREMQ